MVAEDKRKIEYKYNLLLSLFFSFTLFFFGLFEIYFSIYEDVWFDITHIAGLVVLLFTVSFVGIYILLWIVNRFFTKQYGYFTTLLFALVLAFYVQGNFLPSSFGKMDGEAIEWSAYRVENALSIGVWSVIIIGCFVLLHRLGLKKFRYGCRVILICILLVQTVTLATLCITTEGLKSKNDAAFSDKNEFMYSSEKNVVVLVLDMYDSRVFQAIYEEANADYLDMLDGFTYYPDTVAAYSSTYCAIPHILTGEKYLQDMPMEQYINEAYKNSPLMEELNRLDFNINIYTNEAIPTEEIGYEITNYLSEEENCAYVSSNKRMLGYLGKLLGIRYLPGPLKKYCWFYSEELWDLRQIDCEDGIASLDNYAFNNHIDNMTADYDKNMFHFHHIEGTHAPCYYDENFIKTDVDLSQEGQAGMIQNGKGMLVVVDRFLSKLKEQGIYDNCAVIIMADHGGRFRNEGIEGEVDRANPLLLVKGFGEVHPLQVSSQSISYDDLQDAFIRLINGMSGSDVFAEYTANERKRYFISTASFREYYTLQHASDELKFQPTGNVYE